MASWAKKRQYTYGGIIILAVIVILAYIVFSYVYKAPTCFDGIKNGNELGIDCGGSCTRLCQSDFMSPVVSWTSFERVTPTLVNLAAYIVNPNSEGEALNVPYHFVLYDREGIEIIDRKGTVNLPPHRNTLAFMGPVSIGQRIPYRAFFEFLAAPNWHKQIDPLVSLQVTDKQYSEDNESSRLTVVLRDAAVKPLGKMSVYAALYDAESNAIGFSKTLIDGIAGQTSVVAPFTWPISRNGKVISIEVLPVAE